MLLSPHTSYLNLTVVPTGVDWRCARLDLRGNPMSSLTGGTTQTDGAWTQLPTSITYLDLSATGLVALPTGVFTQGNGKYNLVTLKLAWNLIETIAVGAFSRLAALESLDLSYNRLSTLPAGGWTLISFSFTQPYNAHPPVTNPYPSPM